MIKKSILITGASSGIGEALALEYAGPSVFLALSGRNQERLSDVANRCRAKGAQVETAILDVANDSAMKTWILKMESLFPLHMVIANAGISGGTGGAEGLEPMDQARQIFDVNLMGVLNTIAPVLPAMMERQSGQIVIISSLAGFRGFPGAPAYSASKGAVRFYGEALRGALAPKGIKVNVVCPGFVKSRMTDVNEFPMPLLMDTAKAARVIVRGLDYNIGRIAFPWPAHLVCWFLSVLPDWAAQKLLQRLPPKGVQKTR